MITALASGVLLGLSAGLSPNPLLALLLAQTLRHGSREGCKIALTPLVTDAPIILVALVVAAKLPSTLHLDSGLGGTLALEVSLDDFFIHDGLPDFLAANPN